MAFIPDLPSDVPGRKAAVAPSLGAAMAQGRAAQNLAQGIADVGQVAQGYVDKQQEAQDLGVKSAASLAMQQALADHAIFREQTPEPEAWEADLSERVGAVRQNFMQETKRMSPYMRTQLEATFDGWTSEAINGTRLDAVKHRKAIDRSTTTQLTESYMRAGDFASARKIKEEARGKLFTPEEVDADLMDIDLEEKNWQSKQAFEKTQQDIAADPKGWLDGLAAGEVGADLDPLTRERHRSFARQMFGTLQKETVESIREGMMSGKIRKPEDIDVMATDASETTRAILKGELQDLYDEEKKRARQTPEYQAKVVGEVSAQLLALDPEDSDQAIQIDSLLRELPAGAVRTHYRSELDRKLKGEPDDESPLGLNLKLADEAFKAGWFKKTARAQSVPASIADGFLTDTRPGGSLLSLGLTQDEAEEIADQETDSARAKKFRELWKPTKAPNGVDALRLETAKAIRDNRTGSKIEVEDPAAAWAEKQAYGRVRLEVIKWQRANPKATPQEIYEKMAELAAPGARDEFLDSAFDMAPAPMPEEIPADPTVPALPAGAQDAIDSLLPPLK